MGYHILEAEYSPAIRSWREASVTGLALIIALSTALTALYIGTFMDYLTAFTWGATSKALVDGLDFLGGRFKWTLK